MRATDPPLLRTHAVGLLLDDAESPHGHAIMRVVAELEVLREYADASLAFDAARDRCARERGFIDLQALEPLAARLESAAEALAKYDDRAAAAQAAGDPE